MAAGVTVRELMNREYVGVTESDGLVETVELLLREEGDFAVVQRGSDCIGVLTERDILATVVEGPDPGEATVGDVMTDTVPTVAPEETVDGAVAEMAAQGVGGLVVSNGAEPVGILTEEDVLTSRPFSPGPGQGENGRPGTPVEGDRQASPNAGDAAESDAVVMESDAAVRESSRSSESGFQEQSICERCGALAGDLASFNGQLLCADCRDL